MSGEGPSILVVDDDPVFVRMTCQLLQRDYPSALVAGEGTGIAALERLEAQDWDLVLLDYRLPDLDGLEVLAEVRKRIVDVAVVVITGEGDEALAADLFRMGAYDYLVKGAIGASSLRRTVDGVLRRRRLDREVLSQTDTLAKTSLEIESRSRALGTAYDKVKDKKEELQLLSDSLETVVEQRTSELRATSAFLNQILDSTTQHFIIATTVDGRVLAFNRGAEALFGREAEVVINEVHFRELFAELREDDEELDALILEARRDGHARTELGALHADGREFTALLTLSPLEGAEHTGLAGFVLVGIDVTKERELERQNLAYIAEIENKNTNLRRKNEQIIEAARLKSEFLANVSHELRTPLNAIIGYSDLLMGGIYGELRERQTTAINGVATRAAGLLALINDILDLSRIEAGRMELRVDRFSLETLLKSVHETGTLLAQEKGLEVSLELPASGGLPEMRTDRQKLQQILLNLVNNAVKFTASGSVVIRGRRVRDRQVRIEVADSGIGIPESELEAIFDEFRQVDGTSTREYGGTGLGLAISKKFAEALGAKLRVRSKEGKGSVFTVTLHVELPAAERARTFDRIPVVRKNPLLD